MSKGSAPSVLSTGGAIRIPIARSCTKHCREYMHEWVCVGVHVCGCVWECMYVGVYGSACTSMCVCVS